MLSIHHQWFQIGIQIRYKAGNACHRGHIPWRKKALSRLRTSDDLGIIFERIQDLQLHMSSRARLLWGPRSNPNPPRQGYDDTTGGVGGDVTSFASPRSGTTRLALPISSACSYQGHSASVMEVVGEASKDSRSNEAHTCQLHEPDQAENSTTLKSDSRECHTFGSNSATLLGKGIITVGKQRKELPPLPS